MDNTVGGKFHTRISCIGIILNWNDPIHLFVSRFATASLSLHRPILRCAPVIGRHRSFLFKNLWVTLMWIYCFYKNLTYWSKHIRVVDGAVFGVRILQILLVENTRTCHAEIRSKYMYKHTASHVNYLQGEDIFYEVTIFLDILWGLNGRWHIPSERFHTPWGRKPNGVWNLELGMCHLPFSPHRISKNIVTS